METKPERVFVALGTDWCEGFSTLQWTLTKWSNQGITIVILHAANGTKKDYVYTPLGRLPVSTVSEEKLKVIEKTEEAKSDKILSQYIAFCGRVKVEVVKLGKNEQPLYKQIVEVISSFHITKLVMSLAFMKSSSWKSRTAISGSFYVLRHKPDFCELFVICGGRLVFLREENDEGFVEDDRGIMVAKIKETSHSIKSCLGKMFPENAACNSPDLPSSSGSNGSPQFWEKCSQEIEQYASELRSLLEEEGDIVKVENEAVGEKSMKLHVPEDMDAAERIQLLKCRIQEAQDAIQSNGKQANVAKERGEKAQRAISICNEQAEKLEACINVEAMKNVDLYKELDSRKKDINELQIEVEEKRNKLDSILELQRELSDKLHLSSSAKMNAEAQLEKAAKSRAGMVQEMEELRKHRDVLQRRIEFCREKDAIGKASKSNGFGFDFREFCAAEIIAATADFSERLRLKSTSCWTNIYRGRINQTTVAIKTYNPANARSMEAFTNKVRLLSQLRHPNVLAMIGFCSELNCIAYEYMHNGSLHHALFSEERSCKSKNRPLSWHARIRIAAEVCSGLSFLHKAKPNPIIHGHLKPSKILLDQNSVARISGLRSPCSHDKPDIRLDIQAFGKLVVQLLTGKNWAAAMDGTTAIKDFLDHLAGEWPVDLAVELWGIATRCLSKTGVVEECITVMPVREINDVKRRAGHLVANDEVPLPAPFEEAIDFEESSNMPSAFLCPIYQDVMKNPHLAADGFSYELEAIDEWLKTGHDMSPMTNLRLKHKHLTPNRTLRSLIQDWQNRRSAAPI